MFFLFVHIFISFSCLAVLQPVSRVSNLFSFCFSISIAIGPFGWVEMPQRYQSKYLLDIRQTVLWHIPKQNKTQTAMLMDMLIVECNSYTANEKKNRKVQNQGEDQTIHIENCLWVGINNKVSPFIMTIHGKGEVV